MSNDWFKYEERTAERLSEFVSLILDKLKAPYLFRGHADLDWELEPAIDRSDFSGLEGKLERETHERLAFTEFKRLALPHLRSRPTNDWEFLALARHHGVPTPGGAHVRVLACGLTTQSTATLCKRRWRSRVRVIAELDRERRDTRIAGPCTPRLST